MTTNGLHIPDEDKVVIPDGEAVDEATWVELTNHRGEDDEEEVEDE